jgi:hypothetical protein
MAAPKVSPRVEGNAAPSLNTEHRVIGVMKRADGEWVTRTYIIKEDGTAVLERESPPDIRAVALERMHVSIARTFLL